MITGIDTPLNKNKIAIVCVGYNRKKSLSRLLDSLVNAKYPNNDIPLVISIDASGDEDVYSLAKDFNWSHGDKYVNIQQDRLGLKNHIFQCGDLTKYFKAVIILEDDIYVSPFFYDYVFQTVEKYGDNDRVGQISLYRMESNGFAELPFSNLPTGCDVFLMQSVNSWGECWTENMWVSFKNWMQNHDDRSIIEAEIPSVIKTWTKAWSKYYHTYLVMTNKFVVYPSVSLTTNFSDAGVHGGDNNTIVQTHLQQGCFNYRLDDYENLQKYDIFCNNLAIYVWLGMKPEELCLDIYGINPYTNGKKFILTSKDLPLELVKSYAIKLRPIELNIKYDIHGEGLYLYKLPSSFRMTGNEQYCKQILPYYLGGLPLKWLWKYTSSYFYHMLFQKIGLLK